MKLLTHFRTKDKIIEYRLPTIAMIFTAIAFAADASAQTCRDGCNTTNTFQGINALMVATGADNTAFGYDALFDTQTGYSNTGIGALALLQDTIGVQNTAVGVAALTSNITGNNNTAIGVQALQASSSNDNTAVGYRTLFNNTTGINNTAVGRQALFSNSTGSNNIALGRGAGNNLTVGNNNIDIGNGGTADESDTIRIGSVQISTFIKGIRGAAISGVPVVVTGAGQLGVTASSSRFKHEIKAMDKASETLFALKPVTFRYNKEIDPEGMPQFGLVVEDVEQTNRDLVVHDPNGEPYSVRYDAVNAMLLNEFLKAHRKLEQQQTTIAELKANVAQQQQRSHQQEKQIEALTSGLQKVSAHFQLQQSLAQTVATNGQTSADAICQQSLNVKEAK